MKLCTLTKRSLRYHWRSHLGVGIGAALGSAALIGALIVGDSVKGTLRERALERLGKVDFALGGSDRVFTENLSRVKLGKTGSGPSPTTRSTGILQLEGVASRPDAGVIANRITVIGVEHTVEFSDKSVAGGFFGFSPVAQQRTISAGEVILNRSLAEELNAQVGDEILLKVRKPSALSLEAPVAPGDNQYAGLRLRVGAIHSGKEFGNFQLVSSPTEPRNAFVNLWSLQNQLGMKDRVNVVLESSETTEEKSFWAQLFGRLPGGLQRVVPRSWRPAEDLRTHAVILNETLARLNESIARILTLADCQASLERTSSSNSMELRSERVFIDPALAQASIATDTNVQPILTYLANLITVGTNATPYSMVTAAGGPWTPTGLRDDEIVINQWLADDLQAKPGDALSLVYYDPESGARLAERTNTFRVHSMVPMQMPWADRTLMPQFPGIEKAETTAEWDTAFPLVHQIRSQDDKYWTEHRGTPKAFITLAAGQKMWANRFGNLTAIRFLIPTNLVSATSALTPALSPEEREIHSPSHEKTGAGDNPADSRTTANEPRLSPLLEGEGQGEGERPTNTVETFRAALERKILATLKPEELGLRFEPVREQALKAAEQSQDFGGLFIGFSLFVIVAALVLMALLFQFGLEQRAAEIGTLLALGLTPKQVRKLFLREGVVLAFIGGAVGALAGIGYAKAMLLGLSTVWRDAVGASSLKFFVTAPTLAIGFFASALVAVFTLRLALRKQLKRPARELLAGEAGESKRGNGWRARRRQMTVGVVALAIAVGLVGWILAKGDTANAGAFFGAGSLVLIAGLSLLSARLTHSVSAMHHARLTTQKLATRSLGRRRSRSVATAAMLASGTFLIVSIGVFRLDANRDATLRSSGTGGFALIGESTMPVVADLNTPAGRETFALNESDFSDVNVVQFRVRQGDEASCLNLNRAQKPRLLGVNPEMLEDRKAFTFASAWAGVFCKQRGASFSGWEMLSQEDDYLRACQEAGERLEILKPRQRPGTAPVIPAIGDAASIQWAMGKKVGDTLDYVDERGRPFKVRIVGAVANSILQGQLIIDEKEFVARFPSESGHKYFLIDAPTNRVADLSAKLSRALQDSGLELTPAPVRLAQFNAVQNTYLGTFQVLGGLGLLLGSAGLGIVVLRNVLERRGELAVLLAVGWRQAAVRNLVLLEHAALLGVGLLVGLVAAAIAVVPGLLAAGTQLPFATLSATLLLVVANGLLFTWLATRYALRGDLLTALRNE